MLRKGGAFRDVDMKGSEGRAKKGKKVKRRASGYFAFPFPLLPPSTCDGLWMFATGVSWENREIFLITDRSK